MDRHHRRHWFGRGRMVALLGVAAVTLSGFSAGPAAASEHDKRLVIGHSKVQEIQEKQQPLVEAATAIDRRFSSNKPSGIAGFTADIAARTLTVAWAGQVPRELTSHIKSLESNRNINIEVEQAAISASDLRVEARRLMASARDAGFRAVKVGYAEDFSAIEVTISQSSIQRRPLPRLTSKAPALTGRTSTGASIKVGRH